MRRFLAVALAVVLAVSVAGTTACSRKSNDSGLGPVQPSVEQSASAAATQTGAATDSTDTDTDSPQTPADAKELTDIQAELSAIEKELGSMDMPSDSDFSDIESSLR
ncbi:MAG: hypothetical protein Q8K99_01990 [Actinomycetota bacterium]|nr:hypothetical protein [Actinomycetota bacterium]